MYIYILHIIYYIILYIIYILDYYIILYYIILYYIDIYHWGPSSSIFAGNPYTCNTYISGVEPHGESGVAK